MSRGSEVATVNIRPGVTILSVLSHLNYKPWYALAEFVDNAIASFLANRSALKRAGDPKPVVNVEYDAEDGGRIVVRDNAAGISAKDYARAFKAAEVPPDRSGLSEFGMGMKSAACWFAHEWSVRTSALGEDVERTIRFDVDSIVRKRIEELHPTAVPARAKDHYTEVILANLHRPLQGRTLGKVREHLAGIYRIFVRTDVLELNFNGEPLSYEDPPVLNAPFYRKPKGAKKSWRKRIEIRIGPKLRATGWAAIRETASTSESGFALFRRGRLIQGSADDGYRPPTIFGRSNSFIYQRLFGELHLDGFDVSHTKDGIRWEDHEDAFIQRLRDQLDAEPLPLLQQALHHRVRVHAKDVQQAAEDAVQHTSDAIRDRVPAVLADQIVASPIAASAPRNLSAAVALTHRAIDIELNGAPWRVVIELTTDPGVEPWVELADKIASGDTGGDRHARRVGLRVSLAHPFMERFAANNPECLEALVRIGAALALAETAAKDAGVKYTMQIRRNLNELLRKALSEA